MKEDKQIMIEVIALLEDGNKPPSIRYHMSVFFGEDYLAGFEDMVVDLHELSEFEGLKSGVP